MQSMVRRKKAIKQYIYLKKIVRIQKTYRWYVERKKYVSILNSVVIIQTFVKSKISLKQAKENSRIRIKNQSANIIIRLFKYNRFSSLRDKITIIGKDYLCKRRQREKYEKEEKEKKELKKLEIINNIRLMQEEDYLARRIRTEEKNMMINELNQQNINNYY